VKTIRRTLTGFLILCSTIAFGQGLNSSSEVQPLQGIDIEQNLEGKISGDLVFRDESGKTVKLADYLGDKPVVLTPVYYNCPMLCTMILNGVLKTLNAMSFEVGKEFDIVTFSFDPAEDSEMARKKKNTYLNKYDRPGSEKGWHFLTGEQEQIAQLTDEIGFRYKFDEATNQFVHASGIMVLTPDGTISKYFLGVEYSPRDLKFALMEASQNKVGTAVDKLLLYCYHYDPSTGEYGVAIMNVIRILGTATVVVLVTFMVVMLRRDRKKTQLAGLNNGRVAG
jgi:protein SCO1/2